MKLTFPCVYTEMNGHTISAAENLCEYNVVDYANPSKIIDLSHYTSNFTNTAFGTTLNPTVPATTNGAFILSRISSLLQFKNQSTGNVRIDVWELYPKQIIDAEYTSLIGMVRATAFGQLASAQTLSAPYFTPSYNQPSCYPNMNPLLSAWFHIRKHKRITLTPGQLYNHSVQWKTPRLVDLTKVFGAQITMKGISKHLLIRVVGDVGWDSTAGATAYSQCRVDYMETTRYYTHATLGLSQKTGLTLNNLTNANNPVFNINAISGTENLAITNVAGVGVSTVEPVTTVH